MGQTADLTAAVGFETSPRTPFLPPWPPVPEFSHP